MKELIEKNTLLELKGRKNHLGSSIFGISLLLEYTKYKIYEKNISKLLRKEFKNSIFVAGAQYNEKSFDDFKKLNTIEDVLNAKELLKEIYFYKETSSVIKIAILDALSKYIEKNDVAFYKDILNDIFLNKDISTILDIAWYSESAFYYLKKVEPKENKTDLFWIKELEDKSIMIMQNNIEFFYSSKLSNSLRMLNNFLIDEEDFNLNYIYTYPILRNSDEEYNLTINMRYENNKPMIDMVFLLSDRTILSWESLPLENLLKTFLKIFTMYDNRFNEKKAYTYNVEDNTINSKIANIKFKYLKRDGDYYLIFNNKMEYHFDIGEVFSMFEKIFLFSTLYFYKSKKICLKKLADLSYREFYMLIGLNSKSHT